MARYTEAEKADAVALYLQHGLADTHRKTGVPKQTLHRWLSEAGHDPGEIAGRSADQTKAATAQHTLSLEENRVLARDAFARMSVFAAEKVEHATNGQDARGWATASAIMTDKLRLELGEATDRTEIVSPERRPEHDEEIAILYDLTERQAG